MPRCQQMKTQSRQIRRRPLQWITARWCNADSSLTILFNHRGERFFRIAEMSPTRFESLSNDLLIEVFDYLDGYNLCSTFFGLNRRLNGLFRVAPMHIEFNSKKTNPQVWDTLDSVIHPAQIRSLTFREVNTVDDRFVNSTNVNLVSLIVTRVNPTFLRNLMKALPKRLPLTNFSLSGGFDSRDDPPVSFFDLLMKRNGHRLSSMVNAALNFSYMAMDFSSVSVNFLRLRRLDLNINTVSSELLPFLQTNTPNLRSLKIDAWAQRRGEWKASDYSLKQIVELDLNFTDGFFPLSQLLIMFPSLKKFHIDWGQRRWSQPVLDGSDWQKILEPCVPLLQRFTLHFVRRGLNQAALQTFYQNEFWTARKVRACITVDKARNLSPQVKTIYFGRQWHFSHFDQTALAV